MKWYPQPIHRVRKGNYPYKFIIKQDYQYPHTGWTLTESFESQWLDISTSGTITVKANDNGYAWDGCTPKWSFLGLWIAGVPDGHVDYRTGKPYTYYASLVHDALYQYLHSVPVTKKQIDLLFLKMLGDFRLRNLYYFCVKHFGGVGIVQKGI